MGGESDTLKVQNVPLMTDYQRWFLDNALRGFADMMRGFQFGTAYGGANQASYTPSTFQFGGNEPAFEKNPFPDDKRGKKDRDKDDRVYLEGKPNNFTPVNTPVATIASPWLSYSQPQQGINPLVQTMTNPFIDPYRQGMTGNFPRG